ncbi:hypothetical protein P0Y67_21695 [Photobacterium sp. SP02]|uniref:hypothetical protein n=1 Tax=Photobacterium sp. SP02 TaxID=3032280 RepID=UPI003144F936
MLKQYDLSHIHENMFYLNLLCIDNIKFVHLTEAKEMTKKCTLEDIPRIKKRYNKISMFLFILSAFNLVLTPFFDNIFLPTLGVWFLLGSLIIKLHVRSKDQVLLNNLNSESVGSGTVIALDGSGISPRGIDNPDTSLYNNHTL